MTIRSALTAGLAAALLASPSGPAAAAQLRALHVAIDNAEVVDLAAAPAVVLVANPRIADVVVEQGHLIFVIGKQPGQTRLFVYGPGGKAILERDVVVVPPRDRAVTVYRDVVPTNYSCDPLCVAVGAQPTGTGSTASLLPASAPPAPAVPPPAVSAPAVSAAVAAK